MMLTYLLVTLALFSVVQGQDGRTDRYTRVDKRPIPNKEKRMAYVEYTNGSQLLMFFGPESKTATVYRVDDWVQVTDETIINFEFAPGLVEGFKDDKYEGSLIYANSQGNIRRKSFTKKGAIDVSLWAIQEPTRNILSVIPSPDSKLYAAFCNLGTTVYIGDLSVSQGLLHKVEIHEPGAVTSICWRPGTS
jgi:hypothetical protein